MKHEVVRIDDSSGANDRSGPATRRAHSKLALVRPIVAPVDEAVTTPLDPRSSFESAALTVMLECQRFTFHR